MIYLRLIWSYLKIGLFGFGGGYAMLSLIEREIVGPGWITEKTFTTYIGYAAPLQAGFTNPLWGVLGSVVCTLVVVLPSFLLVAYTSHFIARHKDSVAIRGIFMGLRPVVIGLIASAALLLMNAENFGSETFEICISVIIAIGALATVLFTKIHPILVILASGLAGFLIYY